MYMERESVKLISTETHYDRGYKDVRIYPLSDYTEELAKKHGVIEYDSSFSYSFIQNTLNSVISEEFLAI